MFLNSRHWILSSACLVALGMSLPAFAQDAATTLEPVQQNAPEQVTPVDPAVEAVTLEPVENVIQPLEPLEPLTEEPATPPAADEQNALEADAAQKEFDGFDENVFFDAESVVPDGEMGRKSGPRKVDPRTQPGSRLVIVKKNHKAGSVQSQLVAAQRAMKLGRFESALAVYDELYARNPHNPNVQMGRAIALQSLGHDEEALSAYEQVIEKHPRNIEAKINFSGLVAKRYPSVALQQLLSVYEGNPRNVGVIAQIAVVQAKLARFDEALRYLGMAASMEPENASHIFNMAVIADRSGARSEAIQYYEEALEVDTLYGSGRSIPRETVFERLAQLR